MTEKPKNKLFALCVTTIPINNGNRHVPHIYGAVFDVDENGLATDCTPIDFDGMILRKNRIQHRGQSIYNNGCEKMLIFPIAADSADLLIEGIQEVEERIKPPQRKYSLREAFENPDVKQSLFNPRNVMHLSDDGACEDRNPFYFAGSALEPYAPLERSGMKPVRPDGTLIQVADSELHSYRRPKHSMPRAGTNCRDFVQFMLEKIAGVPIDDLAPKGKRMPRENDEGRITDLIAELADESKIPGQKRTGGKLVDMDNGRYVYALNRPVGIITAGLNGLTHTTPDGRTMPLAKFLIEESAPFYDPRLNENNLGRGASNAQQGR